MGKTYRDKAGDCVDHRGKKKLREVVRHGDTATPKDKEAHERPR